MSGLTGNLISSTYPSLLKTADNAPLSASLVNLTDGLGNPSVLSLSTVSASIAGDLTVAGTVFATASHAQTASYVATASSAVSASNANLLDGLDSTNFIQTTGSNNFSGSLTATGSITLAGSLKFNAGQGTFVLPSQTSPSPVVGSAYFSGSTLYIYDGTSYLSVVLS